MDQSCMTLSSTQLLPNEMESNKPYRQTTSALGTTLLYCLDWEEQEHLTLHVMTGDTTGWSGDVGAQQLFNTISHAILSAHQETHFTYENVDESVGPLVLTSLDQTPAIEAACPRLSYNSATKTFDVYVMPTFTHNCHQAWLNEEVPQMSDSRFKTPAERSLLNRSTGTSQYAASQKQPDMSIVPVGQDLPSVAIESGWSEKFAKLHRDKRLWLVGGAGQVQLVLLVKWTKMPGNRVKGVIESWDLDPAGNERLLQEEIIYPRSQAGSVNQVIRIARGQLFGTRLPAGQDPNDNYGLFVSNLRNISSFSLQFDGFSPA
ncbi:predicted protein [Uncinocarpus reesii 1704]|uniref:Uncharacterized protein n=1 Tax=Uncinocarpus reesii (strain UAMH 1704) TaxID=336963 RepID=C4JJD6_UNCRE|nr:uncharacterized protein UREG_01743 [Uncinocarpus reesii 1704]EEP76894.1 predicted protein [Uncinocarpus reesii 1704]